MLVLSSAKITFSCLHTLLKNPISKLFLQMSLVSFLSSPSPPICSSCLTLPCFIHSPSRSHLQFCVGLPVYRVIEHSTHSSSFKVQLNFIDHSRYQVFIGIYIFVVVIFIYIKNRFILPLLYLREFLVYIIS